MKVVIDTNVFISGIFWEGNFCSKIIDALKDKKIQSICSLEIIEEIVKTLSTFRIQMDKQLINNWRDIIIENSIMVRPSKKVNMVKDDPDDNKFIEAAIEGKAGYIISQDKHLLKIKEYEGIIIINPKDFIKILK
ncbi:MAG TPA: putative toxin-antitoxin system toxin component, PIN family [Candidatus Nanoarchaeia archaeon]|nr:putative toxin-antitoxin system toxin component, PIN family [Candidatus Nanoarchaeia archaeon]